MDRTYLSKAGLETAFVTGDAVVLLAAVLIGCDTVTQKVQKNKQLYCYTKSFKYIILLISCYIYNDAAI